MSYTRTRFVVQTQYNCNIQLIICRYVSCLFILNIFQILNVENQVTFDRYEQGSAK